jgi:hypothetical protein
MPFSQSALSSGLLDVADANRAMRLRLEENEKLLRRAMALTSEGVRASGVLKELPIHEAQKAVDEAMMALFEARDQLRKAVICEALEDGMTVEQLAAMFELSPDLVSAYVVEHSNFFTMHDPSTGPVQLF